MGGRPRWRSAAPRVLSGREIARQAHPGRHVAGAGPLSGEGRTMRDPELVARAQRAATRLESAWEQWRALHGLAVAPGQPVVSYVGYSLKEPWGSPGRHRDRRRRGRVPRRVPRPRRMRTARAQQVPPQPGPLQSGPLQQVKLTEPAPKAPVNIRVRRSGRARTLRPRPPVTRSGPGPSGLDLW